VHNFRATHHTGSKYSKVFDFVAHIIYDLASNQSFDQRCRTRSDNVAIRGVTRGGGEGAGHPGVTTSNGRHPI